MWLCAGKLGVPGVLLSEYANIITNLLSWNVSLIYQSHKYSQCLQVHCGRYINGHMMLHAPSASHPLTLSFSDLSVWCYVCEAYIDNQVSCTVLALVQSEESILTTVQQTVMKLFVKSTLNTSLISVRCLLYVKLNLKPYQIS